MENENKNAPTNTGNHHRHRNKSRKHKSYFITPNDAKNETTVPVTDNSIAAKSKTADNAAKKPQDQINASAENAKNQNNPQRNNNRNRNKRKKHNDRDNQSQAPNNQPQVASAEKAAEPKLDNSISIASSSKKSDRLEKTTLQRVDKGSSTPEIEKYADYEEFSYSELYADKDDQNTENATVADESNEDQIADTVEPMVTVVGIRFKASGKTYYFDPKGIFLKLGSHAIVETARGLEYGEVALGNTQVPESETVPPLRPVIRMATEADIKHNAENKKKEDEAFRLCNEKIIEHKLDMKLIDAQYTFDNSKLLFYFTSSGRVDFRELVKDLAGVFRTRIELRQIGIRDEAKMVGGLGLCGRPLCCSLFLTDFGQVSIKMAKEQNLSLNSSKISGICGRLMCCLRYEHDTYEYEISRTPPVDTIVRTVDGIGVVTEISPLAGTIKVRLNESPELPPKSYKREDVSILKKKK